MEDGRMRLNERRRNRKVVLGGHEEIIAVTARSARLVWQRRLLALARACVEWAAADDSGTC